MTRSTGRVALGQPNREENIMPAQRTVLHFVSIVAIAGLCAMDGNAAKALKAPDIAGVWSFVDTVDTSTCTDVKVGTKRGLLLTIDQENTADDSGETGNLTVAVTGNTTYQKYSGKVTAQTASQFELNGNVGVATSKLTCKYTKKKLSGTRRDVGVNSCTVMSSFTAKQL